MGIPTHLMCRSPWHEDRLPRNGTENHQMSLTHIISSFRQFPALVGWRILVAIACKQEKYGITICDITKREDVERKQSLQDIGEALSLVHEQTPKLFSRIQRHISCIARADIPDPFHYYSAARLCLVKHSIQKQTATHSVSDNLLATTIVDAGTFAFLVSQNVNMSGRAERVAEVLSKQREREKQKERQKGSGL